MAFAAAVAAVAMLGGGGASSVGPWCCLEVELSMIARFGAGRLVQGDAVCSFPAWIGLQTGK